MIVSNVIEACVSSVLSVSAMEGYQSVISGSIHPVLGTTGLTFCKTTF